MIILCRCEGNDSGYSEKCKAVSNYLKQSDFKYTEVADFCSMATGCNPIPLELTEEKQLTVIACYPRTIKSLLKRYADLKNEQQITYLNLREQSENEIISHIAESTPEKGGEMVVKEAEKLPSSWFPVIDYELCTHCGQCLDFCLFGVYGRDRKKIKVINPDNCKDNCPACARICPQTAIIFPKLTEKPINGSEVQLSDGKNKNLKLDFTELMGDDIYTALSARKNRSKKQLLKSENQLKAEAERKKCSCSCSCSADKHNIKNPEDER